MSILATRQEPCSLLCSGTRYLASLHKISWHSAWRVWLAWKVFRMHCSSWLSRLGMSLTHSSVELAWHGQVTGVCSFVSTGFFLNKALAEFMVWGIILLGSARYTGIHHVFEKYPSICYSALHCSPHCSLLDASYFCTYRPLGDWLGFLVWTSLSWQSVVCSWAKGSLRNTVRRWQW